MTTAATTALSSNQELIVRLFPYVHEAGNPYFDYIFGGQDTARQTLDRWMRRASSEVFFERATLLRVQSEPVGGFIAMRGAEVNTCRKFDMAALTMGCGRSEREGLLKRLEVVRNLFPPVDEKDFYLSKFWVDSQHRGAGYARKLINAYLAVGRAQGFQRFRLDVCADNEPAIRAYRSAGFSVTHESSIPEAGLRYVAMTGSHPPRDAMSQTGLRIETILAKDLLAFFNDYVRQASDQKISPISKYRAESQSRNPYAEPDDVGLLVAYSGDQCVGYQGVLPGRLKTQREAAKVYWCTASYVLPEFRKRMVAIHLIKKLMSLKKDVVLTDFDGVVGNVFKGLHFQEIGPLEYISVRPDRLDPVSFPFRRFYRLQKRWPVLKRASESAIGLSKRSSYRMVRASFYRSVSRRVEKALRTVRWQELRRFAPFAMNGNGKSGKASFERSSEVVNWMLEYPWIQDGPPPTRPAYYFSEAYGQFRYIPFAINDSNGAPRSSVVLSLTVEKNESKLKCFDLHCQANDRESLFWLILKYAAQHQVDEIQLPLGLQGQATALPFASVVVRPQQRRYLCYPASDASPLAQALPELSLDLGDGDCAFA
jgi:ribosomal protein S18 acetylase RimI-like enzyme